MGIAFLAKFMGGHVLQVILPIKHLYAMYTALCRLHYVAYTCAKSHRCTRAMWSIATVKHSI